MGDGEYLWDPEIKRTPHHTHTHTRTQANTPNTHNHTNTHIRTHACVQRDLVGKFRKAETLLHVVSHVAWVQWAVCCTHTLRLSLSLSLSHTHTRTHTPRLGGA